MLRLTRRYASIAAWSFWSSVAVNLPVLTIIWESVQDRILGVNYLPVGTCSVPAFPPAATNAGGCVSFVMVG